MHALPLQCVGDEPQARSDLPSVAAGAAVSALEIQQLFFQSTDKSQSGGPVVKEHKPTGRHTAGDKQIATALASLDKRIVPSASVAMEAAFHLLEGHVLDIPEVGVTNVEQARAFLWNAAWL